MPRLEPAGPALAISPDNAWLASVHDGKLTVTDTATREIKSELDLPFLGPTDLILSKERLFAFVRLESSTGLLVYSLPKLDPITSMELMGLVQPLTQVNERVLVVGQSGELPRVVALVAKQLTVDPIGLKEPVLFATEAPEDRILVCSKDLLEVWDPLRRRAMFRLHLPISRPKMGGFSSRKKQLWIVSESAAGPLEVFRFSDGRLQARAELGQRVIGVDGHSESPRLVVASRSDGKPPLPPELVQFDLALGERYPVPFDGVAASYAVVDGSKPVLVVGREDGRIDWVALPRTTPLDDGAPKPAPARLSATTLPAESTGATALSDRLAGWRNRLANEKASPEKAAPDKPASEMEAARARLSEQTRRREDSKPVRPAAAKPEPVRQTDAPEPVRQFATPSTASSGPAARDDEPVRRFAAPASTSTSTSTWGSTWRDALCGWALAALESPSEAPAPPPVDAETTLAQATTRLDLGPGAARGLSLLYGQWLLGDGERGLALIDLAQMIGEDDAAWGEALGKGSLGRARILEVRGGRARLRAFAADFLDGRASLLHLEAPPADAARTSIDASHRLASRAGELSIADAAALATKLGVAVAAIPAGARATVEPLLAEARLRDALPLVLGVADSQSWSALANEQILMVADDETAPAILGALPLYEL